jgi:hypothetical protein
MSIRIGDGGRGKFHPIVEGRFATQDGKLHIALPSQTLGPDGGLHYMSHDEAAMYGNTYHLSLVNCMGDPSISILYTPASRQYNHFKFDSSQVDWLGVGVDVFGIVGEIANSVPGGQSVYALSELAEGAHAVFTAGPTAHEFINALRSGDSWGVALSGASLTATEMGAEVMRLSPNIGMYFNVISLVSNIGGGVTVSP